MYVRMYVHLCCLHCVIISDAGNSRRQSLLFDDKIQFRRESARSNEGDSILSRDTYPSSPVNGVLTVEKYSWRSVSMGSFISEIKTTAVQSIVLKLPAG